MAKNSLSVLAERIVDKHHLDQAAAEQFVKVLFDVLNAHLHEEQLVKVKGLGTFKITSIRDRESVDVNTGERIVIEGHDKVSFVPDAVLREIVNKPFAQFETVVLNEGVNFSEIDRKYTEEGSEEVSTETEGEHASEEVSVSDTDTAQKEEDETPEPTPPVFVPTASVSSDAPSDVLENESVPSSPVAENQVEGEKSEETVQTSPDAVKVPLSVPFLSEPSGQDGHQEPSVAVGAEGKVPDIPNRTSAMDDSGKGTVPSGGSDDSTPEVSGGGEEPPTATEPEEVEPTPLVEADLSGKVEPVVEKAREKEEQDEEKPAQKRVSGHRRTTWTRSLLWLMGILLVLLIAGMVGLSYHFGRLVAERDQLEMRLQQLQSPSKSSSSRRTPHKVVTRPAVRRQVRPSSPSTTAVSHTPQSPSTEKTKSSTKAVPVAASKDYDADPRVRTGAYRIVGTARTVTVRKGQTLSEISHLYLGKGMECYVEALNGTKEVQEGQKLKIPELELKRKK